MRLVILGSGTCVPSGVRNSSGYWVEFGGRRLRLDCGAGTVHAMARYDLPWEALTHQVITHFHIDHVGELPALLFAFKYGRATPRDLALDLVGPVGLAALVDRFVEIYNMKLLEQEFPVAFRELAPGDTLDLGDGGRLRTAKTPHTPESLAVRVDAGGRSVCYTGDSAPSDDLVELFRGASVLVAECSFVEDNRGTKHLVAAEVAEMASAAGVGHLVATHSYFDPEAERLAERLARGFAGKISIAHDGLVVEA
jgi:ribonuclease BN (tRNA processing enzyme)